jgi:hypothetical protein
VQEEIGDFEARGAGVVAIGQGTGEQAADYAEKWGIGFPILGDPKAAAYQAFGMLRGSWWTVLGRSLLTDPLETVRLMFEADMRGAALPAADVLRLPGVAIVDRRGTLRFLYKSREPSDLPPNADVLAALDALAGPEA